MDMGDKTSLCLSGSSSESTIWCLYHAHPLHDKKTGQRRLKQDGSPSSATRNAKDGSATSVVLSQISPRC